jgi:hypothetical protein
VELLRRQTHFQQIETIQYIPWTVIGAGVEASSYRSEIVGVGRFIRAERADSGKGLIRKCTVGEGATHTCGGTLEISWWTPPGKTSQLFFIDSTPQVKFTRDSL